MLLRDMLQTYKTLHPCTAGYAYQLGRSIDLFGETLGHAPAVADLTDESVSDWLQRLERSHAPRTRAGHRGNMLILWRFAARRKLCAAPCEVRRCPKPAPMPVAWTIDQVTNLLSACDALPASARTWFRATISVCYETGLRRGDVRRLHRDQFQSDGVIVLRQSKTQCPHVVGIRPETASLVLSLSGTYPLACPWCQRWYDRLWKRLRVAAGLSSGACQQLRRTGATWVAAENGIDAARQFLGHKSGDMWRHYVDTRIASPRPFLPPTVQHDSRPR